ncbi:hypothetical protein ABL78_6330 [Leptomonas seymouri]|uniref:Uncharacterized protein n=1 Tax=Leptomonas seymouri TaxID=5684 RepID=A0A0N1PAF5_LEPSE|nr:hypothetical protein ABL78_6330 [Leptomonas seymouri]|eukprot:KPI84625.1 hypothetical protein ABL78_6330 [Leptomonas seymouri]
MRATLHRLQSQVSRGCVLPLNCVRAPSAVAGRRLASLLVLCSTYCNNEAPLCHCPRRLCSTTHEGTSKGDSAKDSDDASDLLWGSLSDTQVDLSTEPHHSVFPSSTEAGALPWNESRQSTKTSNEANGEAARSSTEDLSQPTPDYVWVALHNPPRNWLHEDIIEFIHHVAQHAGIAPPPTPTPSDSTLPHQAEQRTSAEDDYDEESASSMSRVTSPFIHHLHIPFGRRTGLVYGSPKLCLSSARLATYLKKELTFDDDDFRSRIYFTELTPAELPASFQQQPPQHGESNPSASSDSVARVRYTPIEETLAKEQEEALRTLELDRYLFSPDLLLDIAKSHQRRLVTKGEKVLLDAFVDGDEDMDNDGDDDDDDDDDEATAASGEGSSRRQASPPSSAARRRRRTAGGGGKGKNIRRRAGVRAGTQKHLGRGSMHNMPIPKPYVEGRPL